MMASLVQRSDKALGGVRGQVEDGDLGGMRRPRREERVLESRGRPQWAEGGPWGQMAQSRGQMGVAKGIRFL